MTLLGRLLDRFHKKGKPSSRKNPVLNPSAVSSEESVAQMSVHDFLPWLRQLPLAVPFSVVGERMLRLYGIAYFDHGVTEQDREMATRLVVSMKTRVAEQFVGQPEALEAFHKATDFTEGRIPQAGVGSLLWLLEEHKIPGTDAIPFIMRPEYGAKLRHYLGMMPVVTLDECRPHLVRELVLQRGGATYPDTVVHLHGLACSADAATLAIFTKEEVEKFLRVPKDYAAARETLVKLGLLSAVSNALPSHSPPSDELLTFIVGRTAIDSMKDDHPPKPLDSVALPDAMEGLDTIIPMSVCIHLGLSVIDSLYGTEKRKIAASGVQTQFGKAIRAGLMELVDLLPTYENYGIEAIVRGDSGQAALSLDYMMVLAAMEKFQLGPQSQEDLDNSQPYFQFLVRQIAHVRPAYLIRLRNYIRFFIHEKGAVDARPPDRPELTNDTFL